MYCMNDRLVIVSQQQYVHHSHAMDNILVICILHVIVIIIHILDATITRNVQVIISHLIITYLITLPCIMHVNRITITYGCI